MTLRRVAPLDLSFPAPPTPDVSPPEVEWMAPDALSVDPTYQRDLSSQSIGLIEKIVTTWSWAAFKPPVGVRVADGGIHLLDGQHTAIAAATLGIAEIPVLIIRSERVEDRARAFVAHNQNRLRMTPGQIHHASVAAGDPEAVMLDRVCRAAGVRVRKHGGASVRYAVGDTLCVLDLKAYARRRGEASLKTALSILVEARTAPILSTHVRALEVLLHEPENDDLKRSKIVLALRAGGEALLRKGRAHAQKHRMSSWRGVAVVWAHASRTPVQVSER